GAVAIVIVLLWLSHSYAETLAERFELGHLLSARQIWHTAAHKLALLRGAFLPLFVLLFADILVRDVQAAVTAALVSAVVLLFTSNWSRRGEPTSAPWSWRARSAWGGCSASGYWRCT